MVGDDLASASSQFGSMWNIDGTDCILPHTGYCCVMSVFCHCRPGWLPYLDVAIRGGTIEDFGAWEVMLGCDVFLLCKREIRQTVRRIV